MSKPLCCGRAPSRSLGLVHPAPTDSRLTTDLSPGFYGCGCHTRSTFAFVSSHESLLHASVSLLRVSTVRTLPTCGWTLAIALDLLGAPGFVWVQARGTADHVVGVCVTDFKSVLLALPGGVLGHGA